MYAWRCWREFRFRFFGYLSLLLVISLAGPLAVTVKKSPQGEWKVYRPTTANEIRELWQSSAMALLGLGTLGMTLAGFGLGNTGVGADLDQKTAEFLLTRPRRRRHFFWTGWAMGAAALLALVAGAAGISFSAVRLLGGSIESQRVYFLLPTLLTVSVVFYSLTHLMTVLSRSTSKGMIHAMGLVAAYGGLMILVHFKWGIDLPNFGPLYQWATERLQEFPLVNLTGWWLLTVGLGVAAQVLFDRAEV